jgi:5-methylthioadenosine/S-adenosylhomocysteine deaminase
VSAVLIRNATILTMNDHLDVVHGAVSVTHGRIAVVGAEPDLRHDVIIDAGGGFVLPGFIQTHVHLCQTLFRGYADDLPLMDWLQRRIWPMEAAHTPASLRAAARLACLELLRSGTTSVLTMETVHDTEAVFEAVAETGLRATIGKCMMDADREVPRRLQENTRRSLDESLALHRYWHGRAAGRIRAAFAPRFAVSCSRELLESVASVSAETGALIHTHAAESQAEFEIVKRISNGRSNIEYFADLGLASPRLCAAHCVWVEAHDRDILATHDTKVMHCPGSNLKLGSGIAPVCEMLARGICVSLGSDGAACNNHLDMFGEMRLAATLQAVRGAPGALSATQALWMATRNGARTLGLEDKVGSVEVGRQADLILIDRSQGHLAPGLDPYSTIVYAARPDDVRMTMVDGDIVVRDFTPVGLDAAEIVESARREAAALAQRAVI